MVYTQSMKYIHIVLISLLLILTACTSTHIPNTQNYDYGTTVFANLNFEDSNHEPWEGQYSILGTNFETSSLSPANGSYSGKFSIGANGDYWTSPTSGIQSARSEIQLKGTAQEGTEIYYSWKLKIDSSYEESNDWQVIGQFHDQPDPAIGETWATYPAHSPSLAYNYRQGQLIIAVYSWETNKVMEIAIVPLSKNTWHTIITHVYWSVENKGFIEASLDGIAIKAANGESRYTARNCFNKAGNYLKIGLYRDKNITTLGTVYYDDVYSGLSLSDVQK